MKYLSGTEESRTLLRKYLFVERQQRSDLTQRNLTTGFDMHEGIFPRRYINKKSQHLLFHPFNCFLLLREEHIPEPPSRTVCFWLAVARYGIDQIQEWINNLPFKTIDHVWKGTNGYKILSDIPNHYRVSQDRFPLWLTSIEKKVDFEV